MSGRYAQAGYSGIGRAKKSPRIRGPSSVAYLLLLLFGLVGPLQADPSAKPTPLRFGFSTQLFVGVNDTDARAALKVWAQTLGAERGIPVDPAMEMLNGAEAINHAVLKGRIDIAGLTIVEYWNLRRLIPMGPRIILGVTRGKATEEYLLLVHRDSPVKRLADLQGKSVSVHAVSNPSLAAIWLETLLLDAQLGTNDIFWDKITQANKVSQVVLPVFFKKLDACVVSRDGFRTMCELNPQVEKALIILAHSPELIRGLSCAPGLVYSPYNDKLLDGIEGVVATAAGRQTLALFRSDQLVARPISDLDATCALLDRHEQLLAEAGKARTSQATGAPDAPERVAP